MRKDMELVKRELEREQVARRTGRRAMEEKEMEMERRIEGMKK